MHLQCTLRAAPGFCDNDNLIGWLGFVLTLAMTQAPTARVMAAMEVMTNSMYLGHFALQGAMGGLASQAIGFLNGILSYRRDDPICKGLHRMLPVTIPPLGSSWTEPWTAHKAPRPSPATQVALIPLGAFVYEGPPDLLPLLATLIRLLSFMSSSMLHTRLLQVSPSPSP